MKRLDDDMRDTLRALAAHERSPLGPVERQRIVRRATAACEQRTPSVLPWLALAAAAFAIAAIARGTMTGDAERAASRKEVAAKDAAPIEVLAVESLAVEEPPCAGAPLPIARTERDRAARRTTIDLGDRARFVLLEGARAELAEQTACRTVLALDRGRVAVHARDLSGGELIVRTSRGDVVVHGTIFDVRAEGDGAELAVSVAEGVVGVVTGGRELARLHEGDAARVDAAGATVHDASHRAVLALRALVDPPRRPRAVVPAPQPDPPPAPATVRGEVTVGNPFVHDVP